MVNGGVIHRTRRIFLIRFSLEYNEKEKTNFII